MSDFEEYIKVNYPRDYERQKRIYPDQSVEELYSEDYKMWQHQQAIIDEHTEVIKLQDADLRKYEKQIESLKAQLNNMEACYIEKKEEVEGLQGRIDVSKSSQPKLHKTDIGDCLHFSTTMFHDGKATCFDCDVVVNHKREVIGVMQTKALRGAND